MEFINELNKKLSNTNCDIQIHIIKLARLNNIIGPIFDEANMTLNNNNISNARKLSV